MSKISNVSWVTLWFQPHPLITWIIIKHVSDSNKMLYLLGFNLDLVFWTHLSPAIVVNRSHYSLFVWHDVLYPCTTGQEASPGAFREQRCVFVSWRWRSVFVFLRLCLIVDGLEKSSSLASCDVLVDSATTTQNAPATRQQRGKLSSLGKLFKPWKWRKKKSSDKFQDLTKGRTSWLCVCVCVSLQRQVLCWTLSANRSVDAPRGAFKRKRVNSVCVWLSLTHSWSVGWEMKRDRRKYKKHFFFMAARCIIST